jgi:hypothetical protein
MKTWQLRIPGIVSLVSISAHKMENRGDGCVRFLAEDGCILAMVVYAPGLLILEESWRSLGDAPKFDPPQRPSDKRL